MSARKRDLSDTAVRNILQLAKDGKNVPEICEIMHIKNEYLVRCIFAGQTYRDVTKFPHGYSLTKYRKDMNVREIKRERASNQKETRKSFSQADILEICATAINCVSMKDVAEKTNVEYATITKIFSGKTHARFTGFPENYSFNQYRIDTKSKRSTTMTEETKNESLSTTIESSTSKESLSLVSDSDLKSTIDIVRASMNTVRQKMKEIAAQRKVHEDAIRELDEAELEFMNFVEEVNDFSL